MSDSERERSPARRRSPDRAKSDEPKPEEFKCFVGGIPWQFDDERLREVFEEFNPTDARVMVDKVSRRSRGFGFVYFNDDASRQSAIDKIHDSEIEGRRISVNRAIPQSQTAPGTPADQLRRGQTVPRDHGRFSRGGSRDRGYDRRDSRDYRSDYRSDYGRDRYSGGGGGGGYDRGYNSGGSYRPGYGYSSGGGGYDRGGYDRGGSSYGGSGSYYDYPPRDYYGGGAPPPASTYDRAPYGDSRGGGGGYGGPPSGSYGGDRHDRSGRSGGSYDRPPRGAPY